jgi:hypothetical protein
MGFAVNLFLKGDTNGKEKESKKNFEGTVEQTGPQPAQKVVSRNRHVQNRQKDGAQDRRRQKESVQDGTQKVKGLSETHRQSVAGLAVTNGI